MNKKYKLAISCTLALSIILQLLFANISNALNLTTINIPIEVNWQETIAENRPEKITVNLKNGDETIRTISLNSANQDPSDVNKWIGEFTDIPYADSYTLAGEENTAYTLSYSPQLAITPPATEAQNNATLSSSNTSIGESNIAWIENNGDYYLWTKEQLSDNDLNETLQLLASKLNVNIDTTNLTYIYGNGASFSYRRRSYLFTTTTTISFTISDNITQVSKSESTLVFSNPTLSYTTIAEPAVNQPSINYSEKTHTLTIKHQKADGSSFAPDETQTLAHNTSYSTSPKDAPNYSIKIKDNTPANGIITEDTTIIYIYSEKKYKVTYTFAGELPGNAAELLPAEEYYATGDTINLPSMPEVEGYYFLGWNTEDNTQINDQNIVITGTWIEYLDAPPLTDASPGNTHSFIPLIIISIMGGCALLTSKKIIN